MVHLLPEGTYRARGTECAIGTASTGTEQFAVNFEILDEGYEGRTIVWYGFCTDASVDRTVESFRHMGFKGNDPLELEGALVGKADAEVSLEVEHEQYNGRTTAKVKFVNRIGGLAIKNRMDEPSRRAFGARMRAKFAAQPAGSPAKRLANPPKPAGPAREDEPPPLGDDDQIGF